MKEIQLCRMCTEYSTDIECDNKEKCKLLNILRENSRLKEQNKKLREKNAEMKSALAEAEEARIASSWDKFPDMMGK